MLLTVFIVLPGCDMNDKQKKLLEKEAELSQKEHDLLLMEKALQLKEEELEKREQLLDSTSKSVTDTLSSIHPLIPGIWNVTMRCTETTCSGSAVGDTRKEQWEISFQKNTVIAKTISDKTLVRVYSGSYVGGTFELYAQQDNVSPELAAKIVVRLQKTKPNEMAGQREIIRLKDCRIVYSLELSKEQ